MWARIAIEWCVIVLCFVLVALWPNVFSFWLAALVVGSRQHALVVLGHWALHRLVPSANAALFATLVPLGISINNLRDIHFSHHKAPSQVGIDFEASVVRKYFPRWIRVRWWDSMLDCLGLHADESLHILRKLTSKTAFINFLITCLGFALLFGWWAALLWPTASVTGLMFVHRLRARTEHNHLQLPGTTLITTKPSLFARLLYLPHYTWLHAEHHASPGTRVWENIK